MALEDELLETLNHIYSKKLTGEERELTPLVTEPVAQALAEYRERVTEEDFEAFRIAEGLRQDKERDRFILERKHLDERLESFSRVVGAYNREREKEGKPEHVFHDCTEHDHSEKPREKPE